MKPERIEGGDPRGVKAILNGRRIYNMKVKRTFETKRDCPSGQSFA